MPSCFNSFWHGVIPTSYFIIFTLVSLIFSLTVSFSTNRGLPSLTLRMVFLPSTDGYTWISTWISLARTLYIHSCARSSSENTHARNRTRKWRHILRKPPDLTKSPSESTNCLFASKGHVRPVSKRLWIIFMACSCPNFVLGRLKKKKWRKKKMEKIAVFPFSVYNSSDVF